MRLAMLGLALGLAQLYDCCYPKCRIKVSLTLLAPFVTVSLAYRLFISWSSITAKPGIDSNEGQQSGGERRGTAEDGAEMPPLSLQGGFLHLSSAD